MGEEQHEVIDEDALQEALDDNDPVLSIGRYIVSSISSISDKFKAWNSIPFSYHFYSSETLVESCKENLRSIRFKLETETGNYQLTVKTQLKRLHRHADACNKAGKFPDVDYVNIITRDIAKKRSRCLWNNSQIQRLQYAEDKLNCTMTKQALVDTMNVTIALAHRITEDAAEMDRLMEAHEDAEVCFANFPLSNHDSYKRMYIGKVADNFRLCRRDLQGGCPIRRGCRGTHRSNIRRSRDSS